MVTQYSLDAHVFFLGFDVPLIKLLSRNELIVHYPKSVVRFNISVGFSWKYLIDILIRYFYCHFRLHFKYLTDRYTIRILYLSVVYLQAPATVTAKLQI